MRRLCTACAAAALLAALVAGAGAARPQSTKPLLGLVSAGQESWTLMRIDPLTLARRAGPTVSVGSRISAWSFSPDRSRLVLGDYDVSGVLMLVDTQRMRRLGLVDAGGMAQTLTTFWPEEGRLYAVVTRLTRKDDGTFARQPSSLVAVDPGSRTVVGEQSLDGWVYGSAHGTGVLALLLGQESGVGPARLAVVGSDGTVRMVGLDGIQVGYDAVDESDPQAVARYALPGLVVASEGGEAFVVAPGRIAAVDLRTLSVSYHSIGSTSRRLQRVEKGSLDGSYRAALWTPDGKLLVTGRDDHSSVDAKGQVRYEPRPVGLQLVDTRDWSTKLVDANGAGASVGADAIFVTPWSWSSKLQKYVGGGATIYSLDGVKRAHVFGRKDVFGVLIGRRAFVGLDLTSYAIVSTTTGRILRKVRHQLPQPLLGAAQDN